VPQHQLERDLRYQLAGGEVFAGGGPEPRQQLQRCVRVTQCDPRAGDTPRGRKQPEAGRGDDSQRALAADEEAGEVVAGIVLAQPRQPGQHAAIGQHHLQAEGELAHHPVAQDRGAASIGREVAADLAAAFGPEAQRKQAVDGTGRLLHLRQQAAGLRDQAVVRGIHRADVRQALQ
jgi:hypothetical protein